MNGPILLHRKLLRNHRFSRLPDVESVFSTELIPGVPLKFSSAPFWGPPSRWIVGGGALFGNCQISIVITAICHREFQACRSVSRLDPEGLSNRTRHAPVSGSRFDSYALSWRPHIRTSISILWVSWRTCTLVFAECDIPCTVADTPQEASPQSRLHSFLPLTISTCPSS